MIGRAKDIQVKFFEEKRMSLLEIKITEFIQYLAEMDALIIDLKFESEKEEYSKNFTAMCIYTLPNN